MIAKRFDTDVCSAYLLEPESSEPGAGGNGGFAAGCIGHLRMAIHEGLAGLVAEQVRPVAVEQAHTHPRFKYFPEAGEDEYQSFLGVPLIDRGNSTGGAGSADDGASAFRRGRNRDADRTGGAGGAGGERSADAGSLYLRRPQERLYALARNLWWSWDHDTASLFRESGSGAVEAAEPESGFVLAELPLAKLESRAAELVLHSRINYAYRRLQEYLNADRTWGTRYAECCGHVRWHIFRRSLGYTNRCRFYSGGLGVLAGDHIKSASDLGFRWWDRIVYGQGFFGSAWIVRGGRRKNIWRRRKSITTPGRDREERTAGRGGIETRKVRFMPKVWRVKVGRCDLFSARFRCGR